ASAGSSGISAATSGASTAVSASGASTAGASATADVESTASGAVSMGAVGASGVAVMGKVGIGAGCGLPGVPPAAGNRLGLGSILTDGLPGPGGAGCAASHQEASLHLPVSASG